MNKITSPAKPELFWKSHVWSTVPGLAWIVWDASYVANDPVGRNHLTVKDSWMLGCYFTTTKIRTRHMTTWTTLEPGDLILIPPQVGFHEDFRQPKKTPAVRTWVSFTGENTANLRRLTHNKNDMALIHDSSEKLGTRIRELAEFANHHGEGCFWAIQGMFPAVVNSVMHAQTISEDTYHLPDGHRIDPVDPISSRALDILSRDYAQNLSIAAVARRLGCSESTLTHRFTESYGEPLMETLRRLRLFQARTLIVGGAKLADVAEQTGFWDEHHLGKLFKKAMGVSPGEYRRMHQKLSQSKVDSDAGKKKKGTRHE